MTILIQSQKPRPVFSCPNKDGTQGKMIGAVYYYTNGAMVLKKDVYRSKKHLLEIPRPSWAWDAHVIEDAYSYDVHYTVLHDIEKDLVWRTAISTFFASGIPLNRGHCQQLALPLSHWQRRPVGKDWDEDNGYTNPDHVGFYPEQMEMKL